MRGPVLFLIHRSVLHASVDIPVGVSCARRDQDRMASKVLCSHTAFAAISRRSTPPHPVLPAMVVRAPLHSGGGSTLSCLRPAPAQHKHALVPPPLQLTRRWIQDPSHTCVWPPSVGCRGSRQGVSLLGLICAQAPSQHHTCVDVCKEFTPHKPGVRHNRHHQRVSPPRA